MKVKYTGNLMLTVVFEIEAPTEEDADELALERFKATGTEDMFATGYELIRDEPYWEVERYGM